MTKKRFRLQFKFWLDMNKSDEFEIAEIIDQLKLKGSFTQATRDGLRLIVDLWAGRVGVLLAFFPWVEDYFFEKFSEQHAQKEHTISEQLARLESLLLAQGNTPISGNSGVGKSLLGGPVTPPVYDEDDTDLLVVKKSTVNSAQNFLDAVMSLKQQTQQVRPS